jgi:hypothetical protein
MGLAGAGLGFVGVVGTVTGAPIAFGIAGSLLLAGGWLAGSVVRHRAGPLGLVGW